jgi:hypothetical protein
MSRAVAESYPRRRLFSCLPCGVRAAHNLEPLICVGVSERNPKIRRCTMLVALEVNFALWIMIGCGIAEAAQLLGH